MYINAIEFYRLGSRIRELGIPFLPRIFEALIYVICNCSIPLSAKIGARTRCGHRGISVVIHPEAVIGEDCVIGVQVVIGGKGFDIPGAPNIGCRVKIGAGAKVLGPISIGDDVFIGANAVVVESVPPGVVVAGVPARVVSLVKGRSFTE